jgi:DNA-binding CsgD family transcriptional regulator
MFVSLDRGHGQRPFTPEDRSVNQSLIPHLHAAWKQNLRGRLRTVEDQTQGDVHKAFIDQAGSVVQAEEGFAASVAKRWPAWKGKALPALLRATVERARFVPGRWTGDDAWAVRAAPAGLLTLIELRQASPLDRLSPREKQVAKLYAEGATHKEIARIVELTPATVRHYLREVYAKLSIDNKANLATLMIQARK